MAPILCDGCGFSASPEHIGQRLRRLELATRFRPIHISTLFLAAWPPPGLEDYFYFVGEDPNQATTSPAVLETPALFDGLMHALGIAPSAAEGHEAALGEFQKRGFYLAECVECPVEEAVQASAGAAMESSQWIAWHFGATLVKRITLSYKPKQLVLLGMATKPLIPVFRQAGLGDLLLLHGGLPLDLPERDDRASGEAFRAALAGVMAAASRVQRA